MLLKIVYIIVMFYLIIKIYQILIKRKIICFQRWKYQYKHIQKYDSRKETECAICLEEFQRNDIIKEFYKCKHIFHKECLKNWLKRSNECPLCKHDLTEDINKI